MSKKFWKDNWVAAILVGFFLSIGIWFVTALIDVGVNGGAYDDHPSIEDDDWLRDNYGGTEYYP